MESDLKRIKWPITKSLSEETLFLNILRQIKMQIIVIGFSYDWTCVSDFGYFSPKVGYTCSVIGKTDDKNVYFDLAGNKSLNNNHL